jgi:hypothetical protein
VVLNLFGWGAQIQKLSLSAGIFDFLNFGLGLLDYVTFPSLKS